MKIQVVLALSVIGTSTLLAATARAHEPLWGETPIVFSSDIIHPEMKFRYMAAGNAHNGGEAMRMFEQEYMIQYAPRPSLNLRLEVPFHRNLKQQLINGKVRSTLINGLGDIMLSGK